MKVLYGGLTPAEMDATLQRLRVDLEWLGAYWAELTAALPEPLKGGQAIIGGVAVARHVVAAMAAAIKESRIL
jgi:hypothetical protein